MTMLRPTAAAVAVAALALATAGPSFARSMRVVEPDATYGTYGVGAYYDRHTAQPGYGYTYSAPASGNYEPGLANLGFDNRAEWPD